MFPQHNMRTKLVYVLTCAPEKNYIEQALMAVYSARHWNPDAHIVLITDDETDKLFVDGRAEITKYISEKNVVPFGAGEDMMYRSRWIKTSVRQLVDGDFLFVDCDTICQKSLDEIDTFDCMVGAVWESHLPVSHFCDSLLESAKKVTGALGVDIEAEGEYFSSGVIYVKDVPEAHQLYQLWHEYWLNGSAQGMRIDQPSLARANKEMGHLIRVIPDTFNCILFTQNAFTRDAHILHVAAYRNPCFLFNEKTLQFVREHGLNNPWLIDSLLHPCVSFLPFDYNVLHSSFGERLRWIKESATFMDGYGKYIDASFDDYPMNSRFRSFVVKSLQHKHTLWASACWMLWKRFYVLRKQNKITPNCCSK